MTIALGYLGWPLVAVLVVVVWRITHQQAKDHAKTERDLRETRMALEMKQEFGLRAAGYYGAETF